MSAEQIRIVIFGKGGVGKSTLAANLSAWYALSGRRVLHLGCDPKADSSALLLPDPSRLVTLLEALNRYGGDVTAPALLNRGRHGIDCLEVGGPEPGIGCGGRGIARAMELVESLGILAGGYDIVLFDVLGDVVCGGFAAPLRKGFAQRVVIVSSEDEMAFFAANNICKAVVRYAPNGVALAGLVLNGRGTSEHRLDGVDFVRRLGTGILGRLPFSEELSRARQRRLTAVEAAPEGDYSRAVAAIAERLLAPADELLHLPRPLSADDFLRFSGPDLFGGDPSARPEPGPAAPPLPERGLPPPLVIPEKDAPALELAASGELRRKVGRLLRLSSLPPPLSRLRVEGLARRRDGTVLMALGSGGNPPFLMRIAPPGERAFIATATLSLSYQGERLTPAFQLLLRWVAEGLGRMGHAGLLELLAGDERKVAASRTERPDDRSPDPLPAWGRFFATEQFERNGFNLFRLTMPMVFIEHCDLECHYATPPLVGNELHFFDYPWLPFTLAEPSPYETKCELGRHYSTNLGEGDLITGGIDRLAGVLREVAEHSDDKQLIVLNTACVPVVAGDDVDSLVATVGERCPVPIMTCGAHLGESPYLLFLRRMKKERGFSQVVPQPDRINLVGFPSGAGRQELIDETSALGIVVNQVVLPEVDLSLFDHYLAASCQVLFPADHFGRLYQELLADLPLATLRPPAPFGLAGTAAWLEAVGSACGRERAAAALVAARQERLAPRWQRLRERLAGASAGLVLDGSGVDLLLSPERLFGVPLVAILGELGLGLELLAYGRPEEEGPGPWERLAAAAPPGTAVSTRRFSSPDELHEALRASSAGVFYSDFHFDHRLARAGKSHFSLQLFEVGWEGALRTAERLAALLERPFFARYGAYCAPAGGGR